MTSELSFEEADPDVSIGGYNVLADDTETLRDAQEGYVDIDNARTIVAHARANDGVIRLINTAGDQYFATADYVTNRGVPVQQWVGVLYSLKPRPGRAMLALPDVIESGQRFGRRLITDPVLVSLVAGHRDVLVLSRGNSPFEGTLVGPFGDE